MVKTQSSNFYAEWRNGNDSEMWREALTGANKQRNDRTALPTALSEDVPIGQGTSKG